MKFVVDTNVLMTYFWKDSFTREILLNQDLELFSPEYAIEEINRNMDEILRKAKISHDEFKNLKRDLAMGVEFIPEKEYSEFLWKVSDISNKEDVDFVALALKLNLPIWSNDKGFKKQNKVEVYSTEEMARLSKW